MINNKRGENVNNLLGILARLNNLQPLTATMEQAIKMLQFLCERRMEKLRLNLFFYILNDAIEKS